MHEGALLIMLLSGKFKLSSLEMLRVDLRRLVNSNQQILQQHRTPASCGQKGIFSRSFSMFFFFFFRAQSCIILEPVHQGCFTYASTSICRIRLPRTKT